VLLERPRS